MDGPADAAPCGPTYGAWATTARSRRERLQPAQKDTPGDRATGSARNLARGHPHGRRRAYFALPVAIINQLRVPEMYRAELDELFATDVSGFAATWQARSGTNIGLGSVMK